MVPGSPEVAHFCSLVQTRPRISDPDIWIGATFLVLFKGWDFCSGVEACLHSSVRPISFLVPMMHKPVSVKTEQTFLGCSLLLSSRLPFPLLFCFLFSSFNPQFWLLDLWNCKSCRGWTAVDGHILTSPIFRWQAMEYVFQIVGYLFVFSVF